MTWRPYHHDRTVVYQSSVGLRLQRFDRYAGTPNWKVQQARLAADMVSFFLVERNACWAVVNGRRWNRRHGDLLVVMGGDEFALGHNPLRPHVSRSVSLAFEQGGRANTLLHRKFQRRYVWRNPEDYVTGFSAATSGNPRSTIAGLSVGVSGWSGAPPPIRRFAHHSR